jgi:hypothetical protein
MGINSRTGKITGLNYSDLSKCWLNSQKGNDYSLEMLENTIPLKVSQPFRIKNIIIKLPYIILHHFLNTICGKGDRKVSMETQLIEQAFLFFCIAIYSGDIKIVKTNKKPTNITSADIRDKTVPPNTRNYIEILDRENNLINSNTDFYKGLLQYELDVEEKEDSALYFLGQKTKQHINKN